MANYARIVDGMVVEVFTPLEGFTISDSLHPEVASMFSEIPDYVTVNSKIDGKGKWTIAPAQADATPDKVIYEKVSQMTFQMLFTPEEEIGIKKIVDSGDHPELTVWWSRLQDPRLTEVDLNLESVQKALSGLVQMGILSEDRKTEVLSAQVK